jgi:hypothetical protein
MAKEEIFYLVFSKAQLLFDPCQPVVCYAGKVYQPLSCIKNPSAYEFEIDYKTIEVDKNRLIHLTDANGNPNLDFEKDVDESPMLPDERQAVFDARNEFNKSRLACLALSFPFPLPPELHVYLFGVDPKSWRAVGEGLTSNSCGYYISPYPPVGRGDPRDPARLIPGSTAVSPGASASTLADLTQDKTQGGWSSHGGSRLWLYNRSP